MSDGAEAEAGPELWAVSRLMRTALPHLCMGDDL